MTGAKTTRAASLQIGIIVLIGYGWLIQKSGSISGAIAMGIAGLILGVAVIFRARNSDLGRTVASLLVPILALLFLGGLVLSVVEILPVVRENAGDVEYLTRMAIRNIGIGIGAGIAVLGAVGTMEEGIGDRGISRLIPTAFGILLVVSGFLALFVYLRSALLTSVNIPLNDVSVPVDLFYHPPNPGSALLTFWVLLLATLLLARLAISSVPLVELAPRRYETRLEKSLEGLKSYLAIAAVLFVFLGVFAAFVFAPEPGSENFSVEKISQLLGPGTSDMIFTIVQAEGVRGGLFSAIGLFSAVSLGFKGLEYVTGSITSNIRRLFPSLVGGMFAITLGFLFSSHLRNVISRVPEGQRQFLIQLIEAVGMGGVLLFIIAIAISTLVVVLAILSFAGGIRFIPSRGGGGAMAAAGLGIGAISLSVVETAPLAVLGLLTLSVLSWNIGERGVTTSTELGSSPPFPLETLHSMSGFVVGIPAVGLAWWVFANRLPSITPPSGTFIGVIAALVAFVILIGAIKG